MFPRPPIRQLTDSLLEVADAALRPEAGASCGPADGAEVHRTHPHRAPLRIERVRRRGAVPPRAQHCLTPVTRAPGAPATVTAPRTAPPVDATTRGAAARER